MQDDAQAPNVGCGCVRLNVAVVQLASQFRGNIQVGSAVGLQRQGSQQAFRESEIGNLPTEKSRPLQRSASHPTTPRQIMQTGKQVI
jgi:hypothetical protein